MERTLDADLPHARHSCARARPSLQQRVRSQSEFRGIGLTFHPGRSCTFHPGRSCTNSPDRQCSHYSFMNVSRRVILGVILNHNAKKSR